MINSKKQIDFLISEEEQNTDYAFINFITHVNIPQNI